MNQSSHIRNKILVIPFRDLGQSEDGDLFADGITEEIINALAQIKGLGVSSRTSSFSLKGQSMSAKEIAVKLSVGFILEGSIRIAQKKIRIQATLIDTENDLQVWFGKWNRDLDDLFEIQDEISLLIADQLREHLGDVQFEDEEIGSHAESLDVFSLSLKAKRLFNRWNPQDVKSSIELFEQALKLDPYHADSYVGLADAYGFLGTTMFADPLESWQKVKAYTEKALELNPRHAGAHYQLANLAFFTEFDFNQAYQTTLKAIHYKPNYPEAQQFASFLYMLCDEMESAEKHLNKAIEIDPLSKETRFYQAYFEYRKGNYGRSLMLTGDCLKKNPNNIPAYTVHAYNLLALGRCGEAIEFVNAQSEEIVVPTDKLGILCMAHLIDEDEEQFLPLFEQLKTMAEEPYAFQAHAYLYLIYALLDLPNQAFEWVEKSIDFKSPVMLINYSGPFTEKLHKHERYQELFNKLFRLEKPEEKNKGSRDLIEEPDQEIYLQKLLEYCEEEQPFLRPDLSLRSLAGELDLHPNQLSWLINKKLGENFNRFINHYRVEYFKRNAIDPENAHISLIGLAYESGFNSKTAFNTYFKKETGLTPKEFVKTELD